MRRAEERMQNTSFTLQRIQRATLWLMGGTLFINILSFVKSLFIAAYYGTSAELDAYVLSIAPVRLIAGVLVGAIQAALIPRYLELRIKKGEPYAFSVLGTFLLCIIGGLALMMSLMWVGSPVVASLLGTGFERNLVDLTASLLKLSTFLLLVTVVNDCGIALFHAHRHFIFTALVPLLGGICSLVYIIVFRGYGVPSLLYGLIAGIGIQCCLVGYAARRFFPGSLTRISPRDPEIRFMFKLMAPLLVGAMFGHVNVVVDQIMASTLPAGSIAALNYANKLHTMVTQMFIMVISTVILPFFSQQVAERDMKAVKETFVSTSKRTVCILVPLSLGIILMGKFLVQVAFQRGAFGAESTAATTGAWVAYTVGLPIQAVGILTARVYNAMQDNKTLMYVAGVGVGINVLLNWIFMNIWGHVGIALSTSGVYIAATGVLLYGLSRKFQRIEHC